MGAASCGCKSVCPLTEDTPNINNLAQPHEELMVKAADTVVRAPSSKGRPAPLQMGSGGAAEEGAEPIDCDELFSCFGGLAAGDMPSSGSCLCVDVRGPDFYGGYIPGAEHLAFEDVLIEPLRLREVAKLTAGKKLVVFYCMHGEFQSRLCAEKLAGSLEEFQMELGRFDRALRVGFLVGGIHAWVNKFVSDDGAGKKRPSLLTDFDPDAWLSDASSQAGTVAKGAFVHASNSNLPNLLSVFGSTEVSESLKRAKQWTGDALSKSTAISAVNELMKSLHDLEPEDIDLEEDHVLGSGAGGVVFQATHRPTGRKLAVKAINIDDPVRRKQLLNSLIVFTEKFMTQEKSAAGLMHLLSLWVDDRQVYLVLDFMDLGGSGELLDMQSSGSIKVVGVPEDVLRHISRQVVEGLCNLHEHKVLHRDVKPENILLNSKGEARLADYGISTVLEDTGDELRRTISIVGTQAYFSPQRAKGKPFSLEEDIWGFGCVMYQLATGRHPFIESSSQSVGEIFGTMLETSEEQGGFELPRPGEAGGKAFSDDLCKLVAQCLKRKPKDRPTAQELREHAFFRAVDAASSQKSWDEWLKAHPKS